MYRQSEKKLVKQQYLLLIIWWTSAYNSWDLLASLGHPCKFQRVSHLGSVTARHSSSGRQPNFAALNRGRHLYSAGRPSRWALAHILVLAIYTAGLYWWYGNIWLWSLSCGLCSWRWFWSRLWCWLWNIWNVDLVTSTLVGMRSIAMCVSVCLSVCPLAYLKNYMSQLQ